MPTLIPHSQAESEHLNFTHLLTFLTAYQSPKYFPVLPAPLLSHSPPHNGTFGFGVFFHIRNYFSSVTLKTVLEAFSLYCSFWAGLGLDFFFFQFIWFSDMSQEQNMGVQMGSGGALTPVLPLSRTSSPGA